MAINPALVSTLSQPSSFVKPKTSSAEGGLSKNQVNNSFSTGSFGTAKVTDLLPVLVVFGAVAFFLLRKRG